MNKKEKQKSKIVTLNLLHWSYQVFDLTAKLYLILNNNTKRLLDCYKFWIISLFVNDVFSA